MTTGALISPNLISGVRGSELFAKTTTPTLTPTPKPVAKEFNHGALPTLFGRIALPVHSLWIMKNGAVKGIVNLATLATSWNIVGVGDLTATVTPTVFGRIPVEHMASGWWGTASSPAALLFLQIQEGGMSSEQGILTVMVMLTSCGRMQMGKLAFGWRRMESLPVLLFLPTVSAGRHIAEAGDVNGDGDADLVRQNAITGGGYIWFMKNGVTTGSINIPTTAVSWQIVDY
jgi:hypothetical protein